VPVSRLRQAAYQILHCREGHPDMGPGGARKVLPQGAVLPAGKPEWGRPTARGQAQPAGLGVTAQVTGKFLQLVPFAAALGVRPVLITKPSG
jgi:hypothetical protein